jgi:hypothetical protein
MAPVAMTPGWTLRAVTPVGDRRTSAWVSMVRASFDWAYAAMGVYRTALSRSPHVRCPLRCTAEERFTTRPCGASHSGRHSRRVSR